jgi:hypothetical protein
LALEWERQQLPIGAHECQVAARVARAPDGSWYIAWRQENGWSVGHAPDLKDLSRFWPREGGFALAGDAQLVAEVWAAGLGGELLSHSHEDVTVNDEDASDVVAAWDCPCGVGELDFDNIGEARAAARAHWRTALRETLDLKE